MLGNALELTSEEKLVANKLEQYFKSDQMSFKDKIFHAILIAQHDLEAHHFNNENERQKILEFKEVLYSILRKLA
ncbi:MAG: hypothetical protein GX550_08450 [Syntrophomonadaceae bacterium]|nr:hypothetical protein [Syntrophomonadaceae bacterium]